MVHRLVAPVRSFTNTVNLIVVANSFVTACLYSGAIYGIYRGLTGRYLLPRLGINQ